MSNALDKSSEQTFTVEPTEIKWSITLRTEYITWEQPSCFLNPNWLSVVFKKSETVQWYNVQVP